MKNDGKSIGCVYKVYNTMEFGYLESMYEQCPVIESQKLMKCHWSTT